MSRLLVVGGLLLVLLAAGCGGDDEEGDEERADTTEQTTDTAPVDLPPPRRLPLARAAAAADCELKNPPIEGANHVEGTVDYRSNPPTSGNHAALAADDGTYPKPPPTEALVHALEHGRIIIQFDPDLDEQAKGGLESLFDEDPRHMILTPNATDMPYEVAATAWGHLIGCPEMNDRVYDALRAFKLRYRDRGPEDVP